MQRRRPYLRNQDCRYLVARGPDQSTTGPFLKLLNDLDVTLPAPLESLVDAGLIEPVLRVELPREYFLAWKNSPTLPPEGELPRSVRWAHYLRRHAYANLCANGESRRSTLSGRWWKHFLDKPEHSVTREVLKHRAPTDPTAGSTARIGHPSRSDLFSPFMDYFAYWQAYELADIVKAGLLGSVWLLPDPAEAAQRLFDCIGERATESQTLIRRLRAQWDADRQAFAWLSHYRTLRGISLHEPCGMPNDKVEHAVRELTSELRVDSLVLKTQIRDCLLRRFDQWCHDSPAPAGAAGLECAQLLLQEDIALALEFYELVSDEKADFRDPFWGRQADGQSRGWTPLPEALPYERIRAQEDFPGTAVLYLENYNKLFPEERLDEAAMDALGRAWWPRSYSFRRICLAFHRLHRHYSGAVNEGSLVPIVEETPIDFLLLTALYAEKLLAELWLMDHPKAAPGLAELAIWAAERLCRTLEIAERDELVERLRRDIRPRSNLHDLRERAPEIVRQEAGFFVRECDFADWRDTKGRFLLDCFVNLVIARNYAAHHDRLDTELVHTRIGKPAIESVLVIALCLMDARLPD